MFGPGAIHVDDGCVFEKVMSQYMEDELVRIGCQEVYCMAEMD